MRRGCSLKRRNFLAFPWHACKWDSLSTQVTSSFATATTLYLAIERYTWSPCGEGAAYLHSTYWVLTQVDPWWLTVLQTSCSHFRQQVPQILFLPPHFHSWYSDWEPSSSLFFPFINQFKKPGNSTRDDAKILHGIIFANHSIWLPFKEPGTNRKQYEYESISLHSLSYYSSKATMLVLELHNLGCHWFKTCLLFKTFDFIKVVVNPL